MKYLPYLILLLTFLNAVTTGMAQSKAKATLFFREDWKEVAASTPVTQDHIANPDVLLSLYGPSRDSIRKSNHPQIPNDPFYLWSGECTSNWAVGLRHRNQLVDLTGDAKVKWRAKQSGFRQLRIILKLADGTWLVSDQSDGYSEDWREKEFRIAGIQWRKLNIENVTEGNWAAKPDLTQVAEVGFTDLMGGGGTPASSRLDWIEVYGVPVKQK
jgi:hypothetical protein